jgi:hypothetical protein
LVVAGFARADTVDPELAGLLVKNATFDAAGKFTSSLR